MYLEIKSIAPLGEIGSAPPLIEPKRFLDAISETKKVIAKPSSNGRLRRFCQLDLRDSKITSWSSNFSSITPISAYDIGSSAISSTAWLTLKYFRSA
ncbi:unannotated protein [freshwater metagenome]|uniref:Unannotated protein n=1 Tax=freshwater metagenome TaxID=449393 RepID=A0A6J6SR70_9ZZZZ